MIVYHGTPQHLGKEIVNKGILRNYSKWKPKRIFVTPDFDSAAWYGGMEDVILRNLEPVANNGFVKSFEAQVLIMAVEVKREDLHIDMNLDNRFQSRTSPNHFYVLRDIDTSEFIGSTLLKTKVGFSSGL